MSHINLIPGDQGVRLSALSPKYLHTNSTSHTWPFSAIAELIDNAYDPDVNASQLWIDVRRYEHEYCLTFTDNGAGMNSLKLHKMLSFGFCEKVANKDHMPVGHYGNGFKSGSMRLGKDTLVFTKDGNTQSVGFLSQTYLEAVKADTILVPIVTWDSEGIMEERADGDKALQEILKHSLFKNHRALMSQFDEIPTEKGTRIIIYHIRKGSDGKPEFDFKTDFTDIRIPDDTDQELSKFKRQERQNHIPESDYSLRAYASILYLRPRMQILLRNKKVRTTVIAKSLSKTEVDVYRPQGIGVEKPIKITFGFSQNKNHYGIMMYHRNRLIKPYVRVGYQTRANNQGVGVIGVIQCDFLQPTHNKQDFDYTKTYRSAMSALGSKLNDYWNEKKGRQTTITNQILPEPKEVEASPDQLWVQCDNPLCLKWRKLPDNIKAESLPDKWYCFKHPDPAWQSCDIPEKLEDEKEESVQPYVKKQKKRLEKELEERKKREKEANADKERELERKRLDLQKREQELQRLLKTVEEKSNKQKETLEKQKTVSIKKEQQSPQKLQVKLSALPQSPTSSPSQKRYLVQQSGNKKVVLTPIPSIAVPSPKTVVSTPVATPSPLVATPTSSLPVVVKAFTPAGTWVRTGVTQAQTTPVSTVNTTTQQGIQIVKVVSPAVSSGVAMASPVPGTKVQLSQLLTNQRAAQQAAPMPKIISVTGAQPQIAATGTVKLIGTMPSSAQVQPQTIQVQSPNQKSIQIINPNAPAQLPANASTSYKPLESLKEVNKHAAESSISPVSVVIDPPTQVTQALPLQRDAMTITPLKRDSITVNDRYRLIAPTSQPGAATTTLKTTPTPATASVHFVKISPKTTQATGVVTAQTQATQATGIATVQTQATQSTGSATAQTQAATTTQAPVVTLAKTEPQGLPRSRRAALHAHVTSLAHAQVMATSPTMATMVKTEPESDRAATGTKRPLTNSAEQTNGHGDDDVIVIDPPSPPAAKKPRLIPNGVANGVDREILDKIRAMTDMEIVTSLVSRTHDLYKLRENVSKLLRVLVPELEVDDRKEITYDTTIDDLLAQVLSQAVSNASSGANGKSS